MPCQSPLGAAMQQHLSSCGNAAWRPQCFQGAVRLEAHRRQAGHHRLPKNCSSKRSLSGLGINHKPSTLQSRTCVTKCETQLEKPLANKLSIDVGGKQLILETGEIGRQANGAVTLTYGDTVLYTTACCSTEVTGDGSFLPLSVNYQERFSAAGKTSGGFIKRDGRSREGEVLVSRLTDRPLRPMFENGWSQDTQVLTWVLSYDGENSPEPLAITAAGAALAVSDIPLKKAVAGVRVGLLPDEGFVVNPTVQQMERSQLDLVMAGTDSAVLMIEGYCDFLTEEQMLEAVGVGSDAIAGMCRSIAAWAAEQGKPKQMPQVEDIQPLVQRIQEAIGSQIEAAYKNTMLKQERGRQIAAIKEEAHRMFDSTAESELPLLGTAVDAVAASLGGLGGLGASSSKPERAPDRSDMEEEADNDTLREMLAKNAADFLPEAQRQQKDDTDETLVPSVAPPDAAEASNSANAGAKGVGSGATALQVTRALKVSHTASVMSGLVLKVEQMITRRLVLEEGYRVDGRGVQDVRPIWSRAGCLPRVHGSALFTRGETQALAVTTLGSDAAAQRRDTMQEDFATGTEHFYLQYFFPPSSVGETGRVGGMPGRREVGHGMLAQRALAPTVPSEEEFPYTIRVESTITESNGSSSMASVCGGCLAMLDAGVPVKRVVAGVAMGLILEPSGQFQVLTDILGSEDALGDMDFKVAGDAEGVTAFQMDIKVEGITLEVLKEALAQAKVGRQHILEQMQACDPAPARALSSYAPRIRRFNIDPDKIGQVIGSGGRNIKMLQAAAGCDEITVSDQLTGQIEVRASSDETAQAGQDIIEGFLNDPEVGTIYRNVPVGSVMAFGCVVDFAVGKSGLVHVSELDTSRTADATASWKVGDRMDVKILDYEKASGRCKLSRKAVLLEDNGEAAKSGQDEPPIEVGKTYRNVKIVKLQAYGCFVSLNSRTQGLVHVSELALERVSNPADLFVEGGEMDVKVLEKNQKGQLRLSRKQVLLDDQEAANGSQGLPGSSPNGQNEVKQTLLVESNN